MNLRFTDSDNVVRVFDRDVILATVSFGERMATIASEVYQLAPAVSDPRNRNWACEHDVVLMLGDKRRAATGFSWHDGDGISLGDRHYAMAASAASVLETES